MNKLVLASRKTAVYTPHMPEVKIQGGHTDSYIDPMRFYLRDASRASIFQQDPEVVRRCPDVLRSALKVICRFTDLTQFEIGDEVTIDDMDLDVSYMTPEGHSGFIDISAMFTLTDPSAPEFDLSRSDIHLGAQARNPETRGISLGQLKHDGIVRETRTGPVAGSMGDLNFIQALFEKIERAAFPPPRR